MPASRQTDLLANPLLRWEARAVGLPQFDSGDQAALPDFMHPRFASLPRREAAPQVHLHVLGLSSPEYARQWNQIGVQSFDGSSHFKQAFTGGAFYTCEGPKLIKHQAARPGNVDDLGIVAPECRCRACATLREVGVDTRSFGSNEHNMGRAAHNLNMLMLAQCEAMRQAGSVEVESPELPL